MMKLSRHDYAILIGILCFYLAAQLFQQYVLRIGVMSGLSDLESRVAVGQHIHNKLRLFLVLISMFGMVVGYGIMCATFLADRKWSAVLAFIFFFIFCLFEIGYRSVEFFWALKQTSLDLLQMFDGVVAAVYFPLLLAHLLGSVFLFHAIKDSTLLRTAMALNAGRLFLRLMEFTPYPELNIFSGPYYFPPVGVIVILEIVWAFRVFRGFREGLPA